MAETINRILREISDWREQEAKISSTLSLTVMGSRDMQKEKLRWMDSMYSRYKNDVQPHEHLSFKALIVERNQLAKVVYPDFLQRVFRGLSLKKNPSDTFHKSEPKLQDAEQQIKGQVANAGFDHIDLQIKKQLTEGRQQFSVDHAYYVDAQRQVNFQLNFSKDATGQIGFSSYKATLSTDGRPDETRSHSFPIEPGKVINAEQAVNLLQGRAVKTDFINGIGQGKSTWMQLDFNDKDRQDNYRVKYTLGFDNDNIKDALNEIPLADNHSLNNREAIVRKLQNGERANVVVNSHQGEVNLQVQANPRFKSLDLYTETNKKIKLPDLEPKTNGAILKVDQAVKVVNIKDKRKGLTP